MSILSVRVTSFKTGGSMVRNPLLRFTVETLLKQANPNGEDHFRTTHFNKLLFIIYKRLLGHNIDIKLPYSWYRFGTLVEANGFGQEVGMPLNNYAPRGRPTRPIHSISDVEISSADREVIESEIAAALMVYRNGIKHYDLEKMKDDDYSYASLDFQRRFNRGFVLMVGRNPTKNALERGLDALIASFPYDLMPELCDPFLEWDDTARLAFESNINQIPALTAEFCKIFCRLLRVKQNENVPTYVVDFWHDDYLTELPDYCRGLEATREFLLCEHVSVSHTNSDVKSCVNEMNKVAFMLSFDE
jgi:hypothetical protein